MKMDIVAGSGNDEFYTPPYAVDPIISYLHPFRTIWCPFDNENSNFVKRLRECGFTVIATHKESGHDFFTYEPSELSYDAIVSNPPYSLKNEVFERLFALGKPFAMLVGVVGLFESQRRYDLFRTHDFEIMYMNRRISYFKNFDDQKPSLNPPFSSVYLCHKMLPKQIVFETIKKQ